MKRTRDSSGSLSATEKSGTATEEPPTATTAQVPQKVEPFLETPAEKNVDTPVPVESRLGDNCTRHPKRSKHHIIRFNHL